MCIRDRFKADLMPKKTTSMSVFAKRKVLNQVLAGEWISNIKRRGIEFSGYRSYTPSDDAKEIDWKASLRANKLLIKETEVERSHNIFFLLDVSDSMLFSSTEKLKCEYAAEVIASIAFAVLRAGDNVGLGMFTDRLVGKVYPQTGRNQYYRIIRTLSDKEKYGGSFDLEKAIKYTVSFLNMRSTIILVSGFLGLKENWSHYIDFLSQKYNLVGIMIRDIRDEEIPKETGHIIIEDPYSGQKLYLDTTSYADKFAAGVKKEKEEIKRVFSRINSPLLELRTDEDYFQKLITFFKRGEKEWT